MFSEVFFTFLVTSLVGFTLKVCSMAYKSKCKEVDVCCIKIIRDTEAEEKEHEFDVLHLPRQHSPSSKSLDDN